DGSRMQNNGQYASNVYISHVDKGEYTKAVPIGDTINTDDGNEVIVGLDGMGDKMMFHFVNQENNSLLLSSEFANGEVSDPKVVDDRINTKKNLDDKYKPIAVSMSADGNTLFFAADRKDGYGGTDIYIARMLPIGKWGVPQNLGPDVNTEYDEDFPNIAPDGKTLYFSSRGHFSMGGFDIFKANINEETGQFGNTRNIGYPVNSVGDDMNYRVAQSGRYGYITSVRPEGYGHEDIYRLTFKEVEPEFTVIKGVVSGKGGRELVDPAITVSDMTTGELFGVYAPNPRSMRYILILPPGEYEVLIEADGFETITKNVAVYGKSSFKSEIDEDIVMSPQ
ncbi:MAG: hypothetical protein AAGB22_13430, partial [Bacteroidota bacterium]